MDKMILNHEQNMCAARIFLNIFGFVLEDGRDLTIGKLKIFDNSQNCVGELHFENEKVFMVAKNVHCAFSASYDTPKIFSLIDQECERGYHASWTTKISFQTQTSSNHTLNGEFLMDCSMDSEYGIQCKCRPSIHGQMKEKGNITLNMLTPYKIFDFEIETEEQREVIEMRAEQMKHNLIYGKYDMEKSGYPYHWHSIINTLKTANADCFHVFLEEKEYSEILSFHNEIIPIEKNNLVSRRIQEGTLMQNLDPLMFQRIQEIRKLLFIGDVSLLDNLIGVCCDDFKEEEIFALLGIKRVPFAYQNGLNNLKNSYFEISENSCFGQTESPNKVLNLTEK